MDCQERQKLKRERLSMGRQPLNPNQIEFLRIIALACGLPLLLGFAATVALRTARRRKQLEAETRILLNTANLTRKRNGELFLLQNRPRALLGILVGLILVVLARITFIIRMDNPTSIIFGLTTALVGIGAIWVSAIAFRTPDVSFHPQEREVRLHRPWPGQGSTVHSLDSVQAILARPMLRGFRWLSNPYEDRSEVLADETSLFDGIWTSLSLLMKAGSRTRIATASPSGAAGAAAVLATTLNLPVLDAATADEEIRPQQQMRGKQLAGELAAMFEHRKIAEPTYKWFKHITLLAGVLAAVALVVMSWSSLALAVFFRAHLALILLMNLLGFLHSALQDEAAAKSSVLSGVRRYNLLLLVLGLVSLAVIGLRPAAPPDLWFEGSLLCGPQILGYLITTLALRLIAPVDT
jgi:hypothetical protein